MPDNSPLRTEIIRLSCINIDFSRLLQRTLAVLGSGVRISYAPQAKGHPVGWLFCLWMRGNRALHQHCRAVEGERDRQPPVADALPVSFSNFKERAVRWTVATIKFADRSSNLLCSTFVEVLRYKASTDYGSMGAGLDFHPAHPGAVYVHEQPGAEKPGGRSGQGIKPIPLYLIFIPSFHLIKLCHITKSA